VGHTYPHLAQGIDDATGDLVAAAEDRVDTGAPADQLLSGLAAEGFAPGPDEDVAGPAAQAACQQRIPEAQTALAHGFAVGRSRNGGDAATAEPNEMLAGKPRTATVIGQQAERPGIGNLGKGIDHRHGGAAEVDRRAPVGAAAGDDDAVDAL